ncbi:MAG TPA: GNAT family N-acetyltransferase [Terriglobales bacterium]|nr:GNAT family N-acetyltransferase [Terriglobales bacterium]
MPAANKYVIKPLGDENRAAFLCGEEELDRYLHERASRDVKNKLSAVFILVSEEDPERILGYYTLSAQQVDSSLLPEELKKKTGRYKHLGVTLLGRLAVAKNQQGKGLGALLLVSALRQALESTERVMSFAVVVDAKNEDAASFYEKFGFIRLSDRRLLLPMKTVELNFSRKQ